MISDAARMLAGLRRRETKTCPVCGSEFVGFVRQVYDSKLCANKASYRRHGRKDRRPTTTAGARKGDGV